MINGAWSRHQAKTPHRTPKATKPEDDKNRKEPSPPSAFTPYAASVRVTPTPAANISILCTIKLYRIRATRSRESNPAASRIQQAQIVAVRG